MGKAHGPQSFAEDLPGFGQLTTQEQRAEFTILTKHADAKRLSASAGEWTGERLSRRPPNLLWLGCGKQVMDTVALLGAPSFWGCFSRFR